MFKKGHKVSVETKAKISAAKKGRKLSAEHKAKLSIASKKMWTPELRARVSATLKGMKKPPGFGAKVALRNKARVYTPEIRANMAAAKKGKHLSDEHKAKLSAVSKGRPATWLKGKKLSPEHRAKISAATKGSNNPAWLGGCSKHEYPWAFNGSLKQELRERDGHKCQLCGVPQQECCRALDIHHIDYDKNNLDPVNLITLCRTCNIRANVNREHWAAFFRDMMLKKEIQRRGV